MKDKPKKENVVKATLWSEIKLWLSAPKRLWNHIKIYYIDKSK